jgi:hypothetical protein
VMVCILWCPRFALNLHVQIALLQVACGIYGAVMVRIGLYDECGESLKTAVLRATSLWIFPRRLPAMFSLPLYM